MQEKYRSDINRDVPAATIGEFKTLDIGPLKIWPPVILAPMAGVTNYPYRELCRQYGAGLYVSEMTTARPLVEGPAGPLDLSTFGPDEALRSLQLYGSDPYYLGKATERLVGEGRVDHIDLNFGCPVRKVTAKGGGAAIPLKPNLLRSLVRAVVRNAADIPVTIKVRIGLNEDHITFLDAGRIAEEEGCAAIALHARTAAQLYDGDARWEFIRALKELVSIPVLGNGDIWEAHDAMRMMRMTGCDGVVVGRGCLGRPWLFRDLLDVFEGRDPLDPPNFGEVCDVMIEHGESLCQWFGTASGIRMMRKFTAWYTKGFVDSADLRPRLIRVSSVDEIRRIVVDANRDEPFPVVGLRARRGKKAGIQRVALPPNYLENLGDDRPPCASAGELHSGG